MVSQDYFMLCVNKLPIEKISLLCNTLNSRLYYHFTHWSLPSLLWSVWKVLVHYHEKCTRVQAKLSNRKFVGPSSVLMKQPLCCWYVWNDTGTTTDSWIPEPLWGHESADPRAVNSSVMCVNPGQTGNRISQFILPSMPKCFLERHHELLRVFSLYVRCILFPHVLILFLHPLLFLTFHLPHSWGSQTAGLFFWAPSKTTFSHSTAVSLLSCIFRVLTPQCWAVHCFLCSRRRDEG